MSTRGLATAIIFGTLTTWTGCEQLHSSVESAVTSGDVAAMRRFLEDHPDLAGAPLDNLLFLAVEQSALGAPDFAARDERHLEIVNLLLDKGASARAKNHRGQTPLHLARLPEVVGALIAHGAEISARDNDGNTPLHNAGQNGMDQPHADEIPKQLIEKGADVNAKNNDGETPLDTAGWTAPVVQVLLKHGAHLGDPKKEKYFKDGLVRIRPKTG